MSRSGDTSQTAPNEFIVFPTTTTARANLMKPATTRSTTRRDALQRGLQACGTLAAWGGFIKTEQARWKQVVARAKIKPD